jgi:hypothetical protein
MQRNVLGMLAAVLLVGGMALWLFASDAAGVVGLGMMRLGIMFGAIWLAIPNFRVIFAKFPPWLIAVTLAGVVIGVWQKQTLPLVIPLLIVLWVIGPKWFGNQERRQK